MTPFQQLMKCFSEYKDNFKNNKKLFEEKYIVPMSGLSHFLFLAFVGGLLGGGIRIYYNGFVPTFTSLLFEISWWGLGWGITPIYIRALTALLGCVFGFTANLYIVNIKRKYLNLPPLTAQSILKLFSDSMTWLNYKFYGSSHKLQKKSNEQHED